MADETALGDQALAAADEIIQHFIAYLESDEFPDNLVTIFRPLLAFAWIEGRAAGGDEAKAVIRAYLERLYEH